MSDSTSSSSTSRAAVTVDDSRSRGIEADALSALIDRCRREVDEGILPSCQLAVAKDGEVVAFETIGDAAPDSRYVIFSATKALVVSALWLLMAGDAISLDQRVAELIPEFGTNGKEVITVRQLLLHESGFPLAPLNPATEGHGQARLDRFAGWRLNWEPGSRFEYHPTSAHWVIAELIERLSGRGFREFVADEVLAPLGLARFQLGVPPEQQGDINALELRGEPPTADELRAAGLPLDPVQGGLTDAMLLALNEPEVRASGMPGGGGVSNAADVALFYQALLHNPGTLWDPAVLRAGTSEVHSSKPELTSGVPCNRALGLVVAGDAPDSAARGFGHTASPRTFGHGGAGGQIAFADPDSGVSFCYLTNGLDQHVLRQQRRTSGIASRVGPLTSPGRTA